MEKGTPHCKLSIAQTLVADGKIRFTQTAVDGADDLGFDLQAMTDVVLALTPEEFFKSMTTHLDHRILQDVYNTTTSAGDVYVKLTVIDDVLVVSFRELGS